MKKNWHFFVGLFLLISYLFKNAFSIKLFQDDYLFIQITKINDIWGFLNFFNPIRTYSYKPLPTEVFYFIFQQLGNNFFIAHSIVFITYFIGLIYLYKIIVKVTKNEIWAKVSTLLYGISFIHIFQLYWLATYQEILMFTLLLVSFYKYLNNKFFSSLIFFILALFCKETAILYAVFLVFWEISGCSWVSTLLSRPILSHPSSFAKLRTTEWQSRMTQILPFLISAGVFYLIYKYSLSFVTSNDNYKIDLKNIRLFANNTMWYGLWAIGFPNFMSDYFISIFKQPILEFWNVLKAPGILTYFKLLILGIFLQIISIIYIFFSEKNSRKFGFKLILISMISFIIFLGPILFFRHKWMVRLTIPLIFISLFQGWIVSQLYDSKEKIVKYSVYVLLVSLLVFNYYGIMVHESSSLYSSESRVYDNIKTVLIDNEKYLNINKIIFIKGISSERIKNNFHNQSYIKHFLNSLDVKTIYEFESNNIPLNSLVIESTDLFK